jgi:hypothetical protein
MASLQSISLGTIPLSKECYRAIFRNKTREELVFASTVVQEALYERRAEYARQKVLELVEGAGQ